jgi:hypothetical protein
MRLKLLGPDPRVHDGSGSLKPLVATVFPAGETLVTLPGLHVNQRTKYVESVEQELRRSHAPPLNAEERNELWLNAVDLFVREDAIEIRPDPDRMDLAFAADEVLQALVQKHRVRFLLADNARVHDAVKRAGECWRIAPHPISTDDMIQLIHRCRLGIGGRHIYYHSPVTGTRLLTCEAFSELAGLNDKELREHLIEIQHNSRLNNRFHKPEVDFFIAGRKFRVALIEHDISGLDGTALRDLQRALSQQFTSLVPTDLRRDDPQLIEWRQRMVAELHPLDEGRVLEEKWLGLATEFHMHVQWLPGGRIDHGELILDSFYDNPAPSDDEEIASLRDDKASGMVYNYVRAYPRLEYINVGRIAESLALERKAQGRREVYVVEFKEQDSDHEIVKIIRLQKWDVSTHLDCDEDLLQAMIECEEYTDYVLDRRLGCRRLGMNLPPFLITRKIRETYRGEQMNLQGAPIWTPYFERDYIRGIASDKLVPERFQRPDYAIQFAQLLGCAAVPNMIVGRCGDDGKVFFDDGDEVIIEDARGLPSELMVTHHTGSFFEYKKDIGDFAAKYAKPVNDRFGHVPDPVEFGETYLAALESRFLDIQQDYRQHRRAFDTLFRHLPYDTEGAFAFRWECTLKRLDTTDAHSLAERIRSHFKLKR